MITKTYKHGITVHLINEEYVVYKDHVKITNCHSELIACTYAVAMEKAINLEYLKK